MSSLPAWVKGLRPEPGTLRQDVVAGVPGAIASVPDGMASAVLVGVNPVYGLYASMVGPIGGGLAVSTRLMVVTTTTAAALAAGSTLGGFSSADRPEALFLLSALAGVMMIAAGIFRCWRFARFVSVSVLTGFLTGVAVNIILGQLADYAARVRDAGGHLFLSGVDLRDAVTVVPATKTILESTQRAFDDAGAWLAVCAA